MLPWLVVFALALVPASNVYAEGQWYVHAAIGDVDLDYDESDLTSDLLSRGWAITSPNVDSSGTAWKVFGGFMFNDYFGLEGGYVDLGDVSTLFTASIPPSDVDPLLRDTFAVHPIQGDGWVAAGVVRWPFADDKFALAARAGMFFWEADVDVRVIQGATGSVSGDDDGTDAMWGVGIEWKLNETWSLTADYERYQFDDWLDAPSIGVRVTF